MERNATMRYVRTPDYATKNYISPQFIITFYVQYSIKYISWDYPKSFFSLIWFLGIVFILLSLVLDTLALGEIRRVLFDFWLSFIEITGFAIVLFLGGGMIAREIEWRTIYLMLSKPVRRGLIVLGKFVGFSAVIATVLVWESCILLLLLSIKWIAPDMLFFFALLWIWIKLEILLALILFFSTWVSHDVHVYDSHIIYHWA